MQSRKMIPLILSPTSRENDYCFSIVNTVTTVIKYVFLIILSTFLWCGLACLSGYIGHYSVSPDDEEFTLKNDVLVMALGTVFFGLFLNSFLVCFYVDMIKIFIIEEQGEYHVRKFEDMFFFIMMFSLLTIPAGSGQAILGYVCLLFLLYEDPDNHFENTEKIHYTEVAAVGNIVVLIIVGITILVLRYIHVKARIFYGIGRRLLDEVL